MASGTIQEVDHWVTGTITPASGVTLNTTYSYFRYNPKAKIGIIQFYVTANTRTDSYIANISGFAAAGRQHWGIWADSINGSTSYHRAILSASRIELTGVGLTGFVNMTFELN